MNSQNESSFGCFSKFQQLLMKKIFFLGPQNVTIFGVAFCLIFQKNFEASMHFQRNHFRIQKRDRICKPQCRHKIAQRTVDFKKVLLKMVTYFSTSLKLAFSRANESNNLHRLEPQTKFIQFELNKTSIKATAYKSNNSRRSVTYSKKIAKSIEIKHQTPL